MSLVASSSGGGGLVLMLILGVVYFFPSIVAVHRGVTSPGSVMVVNLFLGWTLIGWVVALAMAAKSVPASLTR